MRLARKAKVQIFSEWTNSWFIRAFCVATINLSKEKHRKAVGKISKILIKLYN